MQFAGRANAKDLAEVFHFVASTGRPGTLIVSEEGAGGRRLCFYFSPRGVTLLSDASINSVELANQLVAEGLITQAQAQNALVEQERTGGYLGEILHRQGAVDAQAVRDIVYRQIRDEILSLCLWDRGNFEFIEGELSPEVRRRYRFATSFAFDPQQLLMEAARRLDEWHRTAPHVPADDVILIRSAPEGDHQAAGSPDEAPVSGPVATAVSVLADGTRTVGEIVHNSRFPRFEVLRCLGRLVESGFLRPARVEEMLASARRLARQGEYLRAARLYDLLSARRPDDAVMALKAGQLYERSGRKQDALRAYRQAVERLLANNMPAQALGVIDVMKAADPDNHFALEASVRVRLGVEGVEGAEPDEAERQEGLADAHHLATLLRRQGDLDRAIDILRLVLRHLPGDIETRRLLVDLLKEAGRRKEAADELERLVGLVGASGDPTVNGAKLRKLLTEIEALDPGRRQVQRALRALESAGREREAPGRRSASGRRPSHPARHRWWRTALMSTAVGLVLAGLTFALLYEIEGRRALHSVRRDADNLIRHHRYEEAAALFAEVARAFRYSSVADDAEQARRDILARGRRYLTERVRAGSSAFAQLRHQLTGACSRLLADLRSGTEAASGSLDSLLAAADLYYRARDLEARAEYDQARKIYARLIRTYPEAATYWNVELPLAVESVPPGARVFVNGQEVGRTPLLVRHPPFSAWRIVIQQPGFEPYQATLEPTTTVRLGAELSRQPVWVFHTGGGIESGAALLAGKLFFGSRDGHVYALEAATGRVIWKFDTGTLGDVTCSPVVAGGVIFAASHDHCVYALDTRTGRLRWRYRTGRLIRASPCLLEREGLVCVGSFDRYLYALEVDDGRLRWRFRTAGAISGAATAFAGTVYVGSHDRRLYALRAADGKLLWRFEAGGAIAGAPTVADGVIYFGADDGYIYALEANTGRLLWCFKTGGPVRAKPTVHRSVVYVGSSDGVLYALDAERGSLRWKYRTNGSIRGGATVNGRYLYVGSDDHAVHAVELETGRLRWKARTGGPVAATPLVDGGYLFVGSKDANLYAFRVEEKEDEDLGGREAALRAVFRLGHLRGGSVRRESAASAR